ncbi:unnamed protein product [Clonostachys rosea f. rosea IK726]|uniref:Uncharacterized protein n=1 Tax=Clonostachys rosea f. rosea IK726 TaxID=1349383 RepID=A0ACA9UBP8_BIOOC|nr:unnamed protein product [Clonostachys rosea f. rosea IK726]
MCLHRSWRLLNGVLRETLKPWSTLLQAAPSPGSFDSPLVETVSREASVKLQRPGHPLSCNRYHFSSVSEKAETESIDAAQPGSGMVTKRSQAELSSALAEPLAMRGKPLARLGPPGGKDWRGFPVTTITLLVSNDLVA